MFSVFKRVLQAFFPALLLTIIILRGIIPSVKQQLFPPSFLNWLSPRKWWSLIFSNGFPALLEGADKQYAPVKREVIAHANGNILEVGPGAGHTIAYYDPEKVTKIVGIEPFIELHKHIWAAIERKKLTGKYDLVAASIEDSKILTDHGVLPESMDTIVCVQVLCSIPNPKQVIAEIYKYLKPGGQLVLFEHVRSNDSITQFLQNLWTHGGWHQLTGCNLNRPTDEWLKEVGEWSWIDLKSGAGEGKEDIVPHSIGRLVKACR